MTKKKVRPLPRAEVAKNFPSWIHKSATEEQLAKLAEEVAAENRQIAKDQIEAEAWFEKYRELPSLQFCEEFEMFRPSPMIVLRLIRIAELADDPGRQARVAKLKHEKLNSAARAKVLSEYAKYVGTSKDKGKAHFARLMIKEGLKNSLGKPISQYTIEKIWLGDLKKKK